MLWKQKKYKESIKKYMEKSKKKLNKLTGMKIFILDEGVETNY